MLAAEQVRESNGGSQGCGAPDRFRRAQGSRSHRTILSGSFGSTSMTAVHTPRPGVEIFPHREDGQVRTRQQEGGTGCNRLCFEWEPVGNCGGRGVQELRQSL
ncbi:hypothetical protein PYCCODRAFT_1432900 [Trametes coccinea BRFM310]|uniref:Uncharacterized protein n=1 Tax=Trametes coccinea (strain BRFM310) TaxID=1353009 RepID=A0A1Y2IVI3_TRAC3|nr:hypothetical protein PYCCODRAFT_1432900 [Trametes coccinea BRFM310]